MLHQSATTQSYHPGLEEEELEDDGRNLSAYDQYRLDMLKLNITRLTVCQERQLADLARAGDSQAKEQLVLSCLPHIWRLAPKYVRQSDMQQLMDVVQAGNEAMIEHLDFALAAYNTCATLIVIARHAMAQFAIESTLIRVPKGSYLDGRRAPLTVRIINQSDIEEHRQGILEEMLAEPLVTHREENERNPKRTYVLNALKRLTKYQRLAIMIGFQIDSKNTGHATSRDAKCCKSQFLSTKRYHNYKNSGLNRLRQILTLD